MEESETDFVAGRLEDEEENPAPVLDQNPEIISYGPNTMDLPPSPPHTPRTMSPVMFDAVDFEPDGMVSPERTPTPDSMTTLRSNEVDSFYQEEGGRFYRREPERPVLPSDAGEVSRVHEQHEMYKLVLDGNYYGPVHEILSRDTGDRPKRGLDISSHSPWLEELSFEFPHVHWKGIDFVPTRHPRPSEDYDGYPVTYEVYNYAEGIRCPDETFDLVHARNTLATIPDYRRFMKEIYRILRPGGLLLWTDTHPAIFLADRTDPAVGVPGCVQLQRFLEGVLQMQGIDYHALEHVEDLFESVVDPDVDDSETPGSSTSKKERRKPWSTFHHSVISIPNSPWDTSSHTSLEIGLRARQNILSHLSAISPLLRKMGKTEEEVIQLREKIEDELGDGESGVESFHHYHTVWALKCG
ncbi:hypothetical protein SISNIDRAFT_450438 [Sistotremastrum niveocremeum HHB9708]|uniref:Uncharacterized protein n=1 Tax=Sistotremastrum niveocremeum HHB9708 TaxID=1314777 RepID=A0A164Y9H5_9AGAM|nr:hypothetical protein SISNIDRAFT_450438 [Sistotremastrum niveocremeum HHB9708]